jgi:hypothetical protein
MQSTHVRWVNAPTRAVRGYVSKHEGRPHPLWCFARLVAVRCCKHSLGGRLSRDEFTAILNRVQFWATA